MAWRAILEADVLTHITGDELEALRATALGTGQVDPVQPSIDQVTDEVRGYIAGCKSNDLGDAGTITEKLIGRACDMIIAIIIRRVEGYDMSDDRRSAEKDAIRYMENVSACKISIDDSDTGAESTGSIEVAKTTTRQATRATMDGLL